MHLTTHLFSLSMYDKLAYPICVYTYMEIYTYIYIYTYVYTYNHGMKPENMTWRGMSCYGRLQHNIENKKSCRPMEVSQHDVIEYDMMFYTF